MLEHVNLPRKIDRTIDATGNGVCLRHFRRTATAVALACLAALCADPLSASGGGPPLARNVDLAHLGTGGFRILGIDRGDRSGFSVSDAGDVNGDGLADLIVGARGADPGGVSAAGESYVIFGRTGNCSVDLAALGDDGFRIDGRGAGDFSGWSVASAGDVNGDGLADLVVGAFAASPGGRTRAGEAYVVFGKVDGSPVDLDDLGTGGFRIEGAVERDEAGYRVSGAGDVNGDGLSDVIIGAPGPATSLGTPRPGASYVVFGKPDPGLVELGNLGSGGFRVDGVDDRDFAGFSVSGAGDVNADGLADVVIGAYRADPGNDDNAGESYVVFGKTDSSPVDLGFLGSGGFRIDGANDGDRSGYSVAGAGDVNGDGFADVIIGAPGASVGDGENGGQSYVIFGKAGFEPVDLAVLGSAGFRIDGARADDSSGTSVSGAGDVNLDGLADVVVGALTADRDGATDAGESFVVFGKSDSGRVDLAHLGSFGFRISGADAFDESGSSVSGAGDLNGDGYADLVIGAPEASGAAGGATGESYAVFSTLSRPDVYFYTDRSRFLDDTRARFTTDPYEPVSQPPEPLANQFLLFDAVAPSTLNFGNWPADFPDDNDVELAINGNEDLDIAMCCSSTFAMGIDFDDASGGSTPSTFQVRVIGNETELACVEFDTDKLPDQDYIGIWSMELFDRLEVREITTANENEFFGTVTIGFDSPATLVFRDGFEAFP